VASTATKKRAASTSADIDTDADAVMPAARNWSDGEEVSLRLWTALARCYLTFSHEVSARISEYGLTLPQFGVLEALHHLGPLTLGELAAKLLVTGGNITFVMDRLEKQGLAYRDRSERDRRVVMAKLTHEGRRLIEGNFPQHARFIDGLTDALTPTDQQDLRRLLKKLGKSIGDCND
jgi:MarR family transcriptional regulator, 2-MHQ and catechol-resistance regulon repressor